MSRVGPIAIGAGLAVCAALQLLPFGHSRTNPPVTHSAEWPDSVTRALFARACGDCHSNETRWPWYSAVEPVSWLVTSHVRHGRGTLNVSEWSEERFGEDARESARTIRDGSMPPANYLRMHPEARLDEAEKRRLARGLEAMFPSATED